MWDFPLQNLPIVIPLLAVRSTIAVTAISWSKTAFAITLLRLTEGWLRKVVWFIAISTNVALGLAALLPWLQCTPLAAAWDINIKGKCWSYKVIYNVYVVSGGKLPVGLYCLA